MFYSLELLLNVSAIVFTLATSNQLTKYTLKVAKEMLAKVQSSNLNNKPPTSTLFWCLASDKVTPVAMIFQPGRKYIIYVLRQPAFAQSEL